MELISLPEPFIRSSVFVGLFALLAMAEGRFPRKDYAAGRLGRWWANLSLGAINVLVARISLPVALTGFAATLEARGVGLFALLPGCALPNWAAVLLALLWLDFVIYWQHRLFHRLPWLWRLHRVHHTDRMLDASSALRFHPLEILVSLVIKLLAIAVLGAPPIAVLLFEIGLNAMAMFNHANLRLPLRLDAMLRRALVTPDMHRVHHSVFASETHSNFGFNLSVWDRVFGSYRAQPKSGHADMQIGIDEFPDVKTTQQLGWLLRLPFARGR